MKIRALVAEADASVRGALVEALRADGHEAIEAGDGERALACFRDTPFRVVFTGITLGTMSGLALLREIHLLSPACVVVVIAREDALQSAALALRSGAYDYLTTPLGDGLQIAAVTRRAVDRALLIRENERMIERLQKNAEELETLNRQLRELAVKDDLTGLFNHRYFREALETEIRRSRRHGRIFSLVFLDVDRFKTYNDAHGHLMGDRLLQSISRIARERSRATTIASRYGGDELILIVPETGKDGGRVYAENLRQAIEESRFEGSDALPGGRVTISLGVATYPEDGADALSLIAAADAALYEAKSSGRNCLRCAGESRVAPRG